MLMRHVTADGSPSSSSSNSTLPVSTEPNCIYLSSLRKTITVKCANQEECAAWVRSLLSQKSIGIRQHLGHVPASDKRLVELDLLAEEKYNSSIAREISEANAMRRKAQGMLGQQITSEVEETADEMAFAFENGSVNGRNATFSPMNIRSSHR